MPAPAIHVERLSKIFRVRERPPGVLGAMKGLFTSKTREVHALEDVTFSIAPGERVAFVGANGAGKSTTIKVLTGILRPTSGTVDVLGMVPSEDRQTLARRIGTVFGQRSRLWWHLPARDTFALLGTIYDQPDAIHRARTDRLVDTFRIGSLVDKPVKTLSLGERMRCELVAALLHAPDLLFLDEPTIGLDVTAKAIIRDLVRERSEQDGCTVLLASHDTGDMESVCDRVLVIHRGRLLLDRSVAALRSGFLRRKRVTLRTVEADPQVEVAGATIVERGPHRVVLDVDPAAHSIGAVVAAAISTVRLDDISVEDPPFEEIVKAIYASADVGPVANSPGEPTALIGPNA